MPERFDQPLEAAPDGNAPDHDARESLGNIDDLIDRIRAAHDGGVTIQTLHAGLADIIEPTRKTTQSTADNPEPCTRNPAGLTTPQLLRPGRCRRSEAAQVCGLF